MVGSFKGVLILFFVGLWVNHLIKIFFYGKLLYESLFIKLTIKPGEII